eukprot:m.433866 g.433866  ORF g.433866 m.433866 type:complete len:369 (-) comp17635_c0_seq1:1949-3055(-)
MLPLLSPRQCPTRGSGNRNLKKRFCSTANSVSVSAQRQRNEHRLFYFEERAALIFKRLVKLEGFGARSFCCAIRATCRCRRLDLNELLRLVRGVVVQHRHKAKAAARHGSVAAISIEFHNRHLVLENPGGVGQHHKRRFFICRFFFGRLVLLGRVRHLSVGGSSVSGLSFDLHRVVVLLRLLLLFLGLGGFGLGRDRKHGRLDLVLRLLLGGLGGRRVGKLARRSVRLELNLGHLEVLVQADHRGRRHGDGQEVAQREPEPELGEDQRADDRLHPDVALGVDQPSGDVLPAGVHDTLRVDGTDLGEHVLVLVQHGRGEGLLGVLVLRVLGRLLHHDHRDSNQRPLAHKRNRVLDKRLEQSEGLGVSRS